MNTVDPIREIKDIAAFKAELLHSGLRDYLLCVLGMNTELMISEIITLRVSDVRNKTSITLSGKAGNGVFKECYLSEALCAELERYTTGMSNEDYLFPSRKGRGPLDRSSVYSIVKKTANACGIPNIGAISLKKTFAYHHYKQFQDIAYLQKLFHHDSPSETLKFLGMSQTEIHQLYSKRPLL